MAYVMVGQLLKPHGLKGEMKAVLDMAFFDMETFFLERAGIVEPVRVESIRDGTNGVIVRLSGIETPERAHEYAGALIKIDEKELPALSEGHYYHHEIIGLEVITTTGERVGTVADILDVKSNDVYVVEGNGKEHLIPAIADVIKEINIRERTITIEVMEGLLQE